MTHFSDLAPAPRAGFAAAAAPASTAAPAPAPITPEAAQADAPAAAAGSAPFRIVDGPNRARVVSLTYPVSNGTLTLSAIVVRRLTVAEVRAFQEAVAAGLSPRLPMYEDSAGQPIPAAALDALDADDWEALDQAALDFLPRSFRGALAAPASDSGAASPA